MSIETKKLALWLTKALSMVCLMVMTGCSARVLDSQNRVVGAALPHCPSSPNCVTSEVAGAMAEAQRVDAFQLQGDTTHAWTQLRSYVMAMPRTTVVFEQIDYIHAEVLSPWRVYTDDLALRLDAAQRVVHLRSSSRLGHYDFGVNRERVESLRQGLVEAGVIQVQP